VALGREFARHWVHNGHVKVGDEKMSKSLGNFTSLTDLLTSTDGRAYRLLLLRSNYRSPVEVTPETIADAEEALARLDSFARRFHLDTRLGSMTFEMAQASGADPGALGAFVERMDDDLDTPAALGAIFDLVRRANALADGGEDAGALTLAKTVGVLCGAMGLALVSEGEEVDEGAAALVDERDAARARGDWARADAIRDELQAAGWVVEDAAQGTRLHR
jgi:cysteinyl-tRNA synthetase